MKRIASLVAAAAATAIFAGFTHAAELPSVRHVRYSECESRAGDVVPYTYTETMTWRAS